MQRTLNEKLIQARLRKGWTQEEACEQVGVPNVRSWQRRETEGVVPSPYFRKRLCEVFGLSLEELGIPLRAAHSSMLGASVSTTHEIQTPSGAAQLELELTDAEVAVFLELLKGDHAMNRFNPSRRAALIRSLSVMAGLSAAPGVVKLLIQSVEPFERLARATAKPQELNSVSFGHFYSLMEGCWGLNNNGDMQTAGHVLSGFLPQMIQLAPMQADAAILAAQGLRLLSLLKAHQLKIEEMVSFCLQSVECARLAESADALSASLNGLAVAYKYAQQPENSFKAYQEAIYYSDQASPLLRSRVYAGAAAAFAQRGRTQEADFYSRFAYESFPDHPEHDPNVLSADNGRYMLAYYQGISYLEMGRPKDAGQAFESYKHYAGVVVPERNRLEIMNHWGRAAIMMNDLETYRFCLKEGINGAVTLGSKKRFDEALNIFRQEVPRKWLGEPQMQRVVEELQLPTEGV